MLYIFLVVLIVLYAAGSEWYWGERFVAAEEEPTPCPHGYEDWDDCPDCRH